MKGRMKKDGNENFLCTYAGSAGVSEKGII